MKVALAFFGQPRFVDNQIIDTYKQVILDRYDTDVFGHMWWQEESEAEYDYSSWSKIAKCPIPKDAPKIIADNYSPIIMELRIQELLGYPTHSSTLMRDSLVSTRWSTLITRTIVM